MKPEELEERAAQALRTGLNEVAFAQIVEIRRPRDRWEDTVDWLASLQLSDHKQWVLTEVKSSGEPRLARDAVNQLLRDQAGFPGAYGVFIAPWVSPRAAEICHEAGRGSFRRADLVLHAAPGQGRWHVGECRGCAVVALFSKLPGYNIGFFTTVSLRGFPATA